MTYSDPQTPQQSVAQRGQSIVRWLGTLYGLYIVFTVFYLLIGVVSVGGLRSAGTALGPAGTVGLGLALLLGLVSVVLYLWAIRAAQKAVEGVSAFATAGSPPPNMEKDITRFNSWLTAGQWLAVLSALLGLLLALATGGMLSYMEETAGMGAISSLSNGLTSLLGAVLSWLIYGAIKNFFSSVLARAGGGIQAVLPAAERAASWLQFVYIVQWIGAVFAGLALLGAFVLTSLRANDLGSAYGLGILTGQLLITVLFAGLMSLLLRLVGHLRMLALDVGRQLDRPQNMPAGAAITPDPWAER